MESRSTDRPLALIVEDDDKLADIFSKALVMAGFETLHAADGARALQILEQILPAAVLLDLHIPVISGDKVLQHIRQHERLKDRIVILATADAVTADALEEMSDFVLQKPISFIQLNQLMDRVRRSLETRQYGKPAG